jgi:hypothetical protein
LGINDERGSIAISSDLGGGYTLTQLSEGTAFIFPHFHKIPSGYGNPLSEVIQHGTSRKTLITFDGMSLPLQGLS